MVETLGQRLQSVLDGVAGGGGFKLADIDAGMCQLRVALLEADLNYQGAARAFAQEDAW